MFSYRDEAAHSQFIKTKREREREEREKLGKAFQRGFLSEGFSKLYCCTNVSQVSLPIIWGVSMN